MDKPVLVLPSQEELNRIHREMKSYEFPRLRWVVPPFTTTEPPRLQVGIKWRSANAEGIEWRDVPTVVLEDAEQKDWGR